MEKNLICERVNKLTITSKIKQFYNLINGELVGSSTGELIESIDPSNGKVWAKVPNSTKEDVEMVVAAASKAFSNWSSLSARERGDYLRSVGDYIGEFADEIEKLESQDNGWVVAPPGYGLPVVLRQIWYDAAGAASLVGSQGKTVQKGPNRFGFTLREPFGVVVGILPWNAPLFTFTIKAAYALAAGNTVIIKPSEHASVSSLRYGEIINEILPSGVINVISGFGSEIGDALISHQEVKKVSLTGSVTTAQLITQASANRPKPMIFELGGKSPNIVFEDANLDQAVEGVTKAIFSRNAGQICVGGSRILVQRTIFDEMVLRIKEKMTNPNTVKLGSTLDYSNTMGPIANLPQYKKVCSYIELGKEEGELVFGGRYGGELLLPGQQEFAEGYWVEPTLFKVNDNDLRICQEEIFGPVAAIMPFDTEEEAVAIANNTVYGLAAGVWTTDLNRAHRMVNIIKAGNVWVNTYAEVSTDLPFGGFKESGYGTDSILDYTQEKACVINLSGY